MSRRSRRCGSERRGLQCGAETNLLAQTASHWLRHRISGDANADGIVNGLDITLMMSHWLQTAQSTATVPEPSAVLLAASATLAALLIWRQNL
jgi:hypothetical protein